MTSTHHPLWTASWTIGPITAGPATQAEKNVWIVPLSTSLQRAPTYLRLVLPAGTPRGLLLVLPVQAGVRTRFGDGLREVVAAGATSSQGLLVAAPTFADSPWGVDHARDPSVRQESYLLAVLALLAQILTWAGADRAPRFALGFSKAGFAAVNLLLRHPDLIDGVSVWDASLLRERAWPEQLLQVAGSRQHAATYSIPAALPAAATWLVPSGPRLALAGYGTLREDLHVAHRQLTQLGIAHLYRDGPERAHRWDSGWVPDALNALTGLAAWPR